MNEPTTPIRLDVLSLQVLEAGVESFSTSDSTMEYMMACSTDDVICIDRSIRC